MGADYQRIGNLSLTDLVRTDPEGLSHYFDTVPKFYKSKAIGRERAHGAGRGGWQSRLSDGEHFKQLWCAVLNQAINEANGDTWLVSAKTNDQPVIDAARAYLTTDSSDLREVCSNAGVPVDEVLKRFRSKFSANGGNSATRD